MEPISPESSDAVAKFFEFVNTVFGFITKPIEARLLTSAKVNDIILTAKAEVMAEQIKADGQFNLQQRAQQRMAVEQVTRQSNLESIIYKAPKYIEGDFRPPKDPEWWTRFQQKAQDIKTEDLQEIWASVLAGAMSKNGSVSIRTLDVLSNLSTDEAKLFNAFTSISTIDGKIFLPDPNCFHYSFTLSPEHLILLNEAGLINNNILQHELHTGIYKEKLNEIWLTDTAGYSTLLKYRNKVLILSKELEVKSSSPVTLPYYGFTKAGRDLFLISKPNDNNNFIRQIMAGLKKDGYSIRVVEQTTGD